jgi:hypothetical protein
LKGETSGHFQRVDALYINCELNSLLVQVTSFGPMCHTGQPTCFYRRVRDLRREMRCPAGDLEQQLRQLYRIYEHLRDADLTQQSATARLLHAPDPALLQARLAEELVELAGVADGTHSHAGLPDDAILEASQVCYWTYLLAVVASLPYDTLAPHMPLAAPKPTTPAAAAGQGRELAAVLTHLAPPIATPILDTVLRQVATTCAALGVATAHVVEYDLAQMRERPYLTALFAGAAC